MRYLLYLFLVLFFTNCRNSDKTNLPEDNLVVVDTLSTESQVSVIDTLVKESRPFAINRIKCYWKHSLISSNGFIGEIIMELKNTETDSTIFNYDHVTKYPEEYNYNSESYFDEINKTHLIDVNFDGYKDFVIYSYGSMPMTSQTHIFIFNPQTTTFEINPEIDPDSHIIESRDSIRRILVVSNFDMESTYETSYHFNKNGSITFIEKIAERVLESKDTMQLTERKYQKIIKDKIVESKIDTVSYQ